MDAIVRVPPLVLQAIFANLTQLARHTGFVLRLRALQPDAFAHTFCLYLIRFPDATLQQLADQLHITASALAQRLTDTAARFLRAVLQRTLDCLATTIPPRCVIPLLQRFNGVYLVDGTTVSLPAALAERFPGCGGGAGTDDPATAAAVKILLRLRIDTTQATELLLDAATTPDIRLLQQLPDLPPGALHIGDLGFFDGDYFAGLTRQGIYWLTRLPARIHVRESGGDWQELAEWLRVLDRLGQTRWEGTLEVGKATPVTARVMVLRCPPEESARRRQKLHERMRRKGQTAGARQLTLCDWWLLASNVPEEKLPVSAAWDLYRLRWQIEIDQANDTSSASCCQGGQAGYDSGNRVLGLGQVAKATRQESSRRIRMFDNSQSTIPPRAHRKPGQFRQPAAHGSDCRRRVGRNCTGYSVR